MDSCSPVLGVVKPCLLLALVLGPCSVLDLVLVLVLVLVLYLGLPLAHGLTLGLGLRLVLDGCQRVPS